MLNILDVSWKGNRSERYEKSEEDNAPEELPFPVEWRLVIHWGRMPETKEDDEDKKEEPSWVVKYGDKSHYGNGNEEDDPAPLSKEAISDMASV